MKKKKMYNNRFSAVKIAATATYNNLAIILAIGTFNFGREFRDVCGKNVCVCA